MQRWVGNRCGWRRVYTAVFFAAACHLSAITKETNTMFETSTPQQHAEVIRANRKAYTIRMDGTADMDNTLTRYHGGFTVAFQPNLALTIENTGATSVKNPRVITNDQRRWWNSAEMCREICEGASDDQERILRTWDFIRQHRSHQSELMSLEEELCDPVKMMNIYGWGRCGHMGLVANALFDRAGLNSNDPARRLVIRGMHGHMMCEVWHDGAYQFIDPDEGAVFLDRENEKPVSGDTMMHDHDLAKREDIKGYWFTELGSTEIGAAMMGSDDTLDKSSIYSGHEMNLTLRPGEKIVWRWENEAQHPGDYARQLRDRKFSTHVYAPRLAPDEYASGVHDQKDIEADGEGLAGVSRDGFVLYRMANPYPAWSGRIKARFAGSDTGDVFRVAFSRDGQNWTDAWSQAGAGEFYCDLDLSQLKILRWERSRVCYEYFIRVALASAEQGSARLKSLALETDLFVWPLSLPALGLGENKVVYTDETERPHEVTVTHCWHESGNIQPPDAPAAPVFPADGDTVRATTFQLQWPVMKDARRYHLQVSRFPDMRLCYRACFDVLTEQTAHGSRFAGMFSPDVDYYWRVRAENAAGLWGKWSSIWRFRWDGPRVPINLKSRIEGPRIVISWEPNPRGPRPASYDIYGSDERGFSISKEPYTVYGLGTAPPNFLAVTTNNEMLVAAPDATAPNMNKSYYRVVAVDENGTAGGCSDYIEMPHPFIYTDPARKAEAGQPYEYRVRTLQSIGDLQARRAKKLEDRYAYWEKEGYSFWLAAGPAWLTLDPQTGVLSGTPAASDAGVAAVEVVAKRTWPSEVPLVRNAEGRFINSQFQKTAERFQASWTQAFEIAVSR